MTLAQKIRRAKHVGVKECRAHFSEIVGKKEPQVIMRQNKPVGIYLPYDEALDLMDDIADMADPALAKKIEESWKSYEAGNFTPFEKTARKFRGK